MSFHRVLDISYNKVGKKIYKLEHLPDQLLRKSKSLFTNKSLQKKNPVPIKVDVYAMVSGLPFPEKLIKSLIKIKKKIKQNLQDSTCYWVEPKNLAVEYCVFKWPSDDLKKKWIIDIENYLRREKIKIFNFSIVGIQIHEDGCIIAKGYDDQATIRKIRSNLISNFKFLPSKQSNWAHIPLGRILEPVSKIKFQNLKKIAKRLSKKKIGTIKINRIKIVNEKQWYMKKKKIIFIKNLI